MTAKETELIKAIKEIPDCNEYGYKFESDLLVVIASVMGYKISTEYRHRGIYRKIADPKEFEKAIKIRNGLKAHNIVKSSKTGTTFKVLV